jgi:ribosomal protein L35AE/L33A
MIMSDQSYKKYIGELVSVLVRKEDGTKESKEGVITRIDVERGIVWVLFERLREEAHAYPEEIDNGTIVFK